MMKVYHFGSAIHPMTEDQRANMDSGIALLLGVDKDKSTYFQTSNFDHYQKWYNEVYRNGKANSTLPCLLAIIMMHVSTNLNKDAMLESLLNSIVNENHQRYSSYGIPDVIILLRLCNHLTRIGDSIFDYVSSEPNGAPIPFSPKELA